jgi:histidinol-phosphate aminotransferase
LSLSVLAFTSPQKSYVTADPCFETGMHMAAVAGARVVKVPMTKTYAHDVKAMLAADPDAGLFYVCNPNNPTGTLTSHSDIEYLVANKPKDSVVLIDEAYIHLSETPSALDLVKAGKDVIVLRTFSKVYGMAGIRCGFAIGRPDLLDKLRAYCQNAMPITAASAATASLRDDTLVPTRKKIIADIRNDTCDWLTSNGYTVVPSQTNCFMIDTKRDGQAVYDAMVKKKVYIGRVWSVWPTHVRVTVGTKDEMAKFKVAFKEVMDSPATARLELPHDLVNTPFSHLG